MVGTSTGDPRFFSRSGPHHLAAVAKAASGIAPEFDLLLEGVAPLQTAGPNEVSFLDNPHYVSTLEQSFAGAVIVHPDMQARVPAATVPIVTSEPYEGWALLPISKRNIALGRWFAPPSSPRSFQIVVDGSPATHLCRLRLDWRLPRAFVLHID